MAKTYKLINSATELKQLHEELKPLGKRGVGISKGRILYVWDEDRNNLRSVSPEEAAEILGLSTKQVDRIIDTLGEVVFTEEPAPIVDDTLIYDLEPEVVEVTEPEAVDEVVEEAAAEPEVVEPETEENPLLILRDLLSDAIDIIDHLINK